VHAGEDQQQVWRDLAAALREAVLALQEQVPPNPNQLDRPEVAAYERAYQDRVRRRRQQHQGGGEPSFNVQHPEQQHPEQQHPELLGKGQQPLGVLRSRGVFGGAPRQVVIEDEASAAAAAADGRPCARPPESAPSSWLWWGSLWACGLAKQE
jgi:hypothetical protein